MDIGVRIRGRPIDNEWAQLGAISVHEGEVRRLKIQVPSVSWWLSPLSCSIWLAQFARIAIGPVF